MELKVKKLHPDAIIPTRANPTDSGMDLYSLEDVVLKPGETKLIKTGITFEIPVGYEIQVRPRSGMSLKTKFRIANAPGTVDQSYRGDISIIGVNTGNPLSSRDGLIEIKKGDRVAQAVLCPVIIPQLVEVKEFDNQTIRGANGFGSTGK